MKIAYFTESMLPWVDGVSLTLSHLFDTLEAKGVDFRVYSPFVPGPSIAWSGRVRRVRSLAFPLYPDYRVSVPVGQGIADELDAYRPDLVHVVSPTPTAVWAQRYARRRGIPAVASFHTHFVSYFRYYGVRRLEGFGWRVLRWFYARCAEVYAPSSAILDELAEHGIRNTALWSRGIETDRFAPDRHDPALRAEAGAEEGTPIVLMVSRLVKEKDLAELIPMDRALRRRGHRYRLVLVGDGPLRETLQAGLPDAYFAGHCEGERLARWYASGDVFVFPSTTETFGNVVLEALASGLPAVVVDRGGPQDLVTDGETGYVAPANAPDALAERVGRLLADAGERRRMGGRAREAALGRSWDAVNTGLIERYERVVARGGSVRPAA